MAASRVSTTKLVPSHIVSPIRPRSFATSQARFQSIAPVRKPVGAFRGTIFGFLLGTVTAGYGMYYYVIDDYKVSNNLLTEDIYALQNAVQRLDDHVRTLESGSSTAGKS